VVRLLDADSATTLAVSFRNNAGALVDVTYSTLTATIFDYTNTQVLQTSSGFTTVSTGVQDFYLDPSVLSTIGTYRLICFGERGANRIYSDSPELFEIATLGNFITYASVKELVDYLELTEPIPISLIRDILNTVTAQIDNYCSRSFRQVAIIDEEHWLDTVTEVFLRKYPVMAISSMTIDGSAIDASAYDVLKEQSRISFNTPIGSRGSGQTYNSRTGIFKVSYTAGIDTVPQSVNLAALKWASYLFLRRKRDGLSSESLLGYSYGLQGDNPILMDIKPLLDPHKHIRVV
jgi:hypothetical protein